MVCIFETLYYSILKKSVTINDGFLSKVPFLLVCVNSAMKKTSPAPGPSPLFLGWVEGLAEAPTETTQRLPALCTKWAPMSPRGRLHADMARRSGCSYNSQSDVYLHSTPLTDSERAPVGGADPRVARREPFFSPHGR